MATRSANGKIRTDASNVPGTMSDHPRLTAREFGMALLVATIAFLAYWPSLGSGFVYDGLLEIEEGFFTSLSNLPDVLTLKVLSSHLILANRPGQLLYLMLLAAVCGTKPLGYHLGANLLHAVTTGMLFVFLLKLGRSEFPGARALRVQLAAATATLIFALHPLAVEPVAAINYNSDVLVAFFTLGALLAGTAFRPGDPRSMWLCGIIGVLGSLAAVTCKLSGLAACGALVVYWFLYRRREVKGPWLWFLGITAAMSIAFAAATFLFAAPLRPGEIAPWLGGSMPQMLLTQPRVWVFMMSKIACPLALSADYRMENIGITTLPALLALAVVLALQAWLTWRSRLGAMGVALFWLGLATVSNFVPLYRFTGDRFYYLPMAGVAAQLLALLLVTVRMRDGFWAALIPCLLTLVPLTWLTIERQAVFTSELTLWADTVQVSPTSPIAHSNLGTTLGKAGRYDEAIVQLTMSLALDPTKASTHNDLGNAYLYKDQYGAAIAEYKKSLECDPNHIDASVNLAYAYIDNGQPQDALAEFQHALQISPTNADAQQGLALARQLLSHGGGATH